MRWRFWRRLGACSTIVEGYHQDIAGNTDPPGAKCALTRQGFEIARIEPSPGTAHIEKTKHDITITCQKDGFKETTYLNKSGAAAATFGNILAGGGIGWAIDSASGSDNKYDSPVDIKLAPLATAESAPAK